MDKSTRTSVERQAPAVVFDTAARFCAALAGPGRLLTFQGFDDSPAKRPELARILHGTLEQKFEELEALNEKGAGIFITVNETDGKGRAASNITALRALFCDFDNAELPLNFHAEPNIVVQRDETHAHCYWLLKPGAPLDAFTPAQERLAAFYHSDPKVKDLPRVMRLPGFLHRKGEPCALRLNVIRKDRRALAELLIGLPELKKPERIAQPAQNENGNEHQFRTWAAMVAQDAVEGQRNQTLFKIAAEGAARGIPKRVVFGLCLSHSNGLGEIEVRRTVESAFSKPRTANPLPPRVVKARALDAPPYNFTGAEEVERQIQDERDGKRYAIEWPKFQGLTRTKALLPNSVTVLVGSPGAGKSLFMLECLWRWHFADVNCAALMAEKGVAFHLRRCLAQLAEESRITDDWFSRHESAKVEALLKQHCERLRRLEKHKVIQAPREKDNVAAEYLLTWVERELQAGRRVLSIDPVTIMDTSARPWEDHKRFVREAGRLANEYQASIICVTHPKSTPGGARLTPCLENVSGGRAWREFSDTLLWLEAHDERRGTTETLHAVGEQNWNRTLHILKSRLGGGAGKRLAVRFDAKSLWHYDLGFIAEDMK